jgi:hypothetical protein
MKDAKQKQIEITNNNLVKDFKKIFFNLNNREPMDTEIIDNLKDKIELSVLQSIINEQKTNEIIEFDSFVNV